MAVLYDSLERHTHFLLECYANGSLKRPLSLHLLVQNSEGNVFEIRNRGDFFVEKHFLSNDVNQKPILGKFRFDIFIFKLFLNPLGKTKFYLLAQDVEISVLVFGKDTINLARLKVLNCVFKLDW